VLDFNEHCCEIAGKNEIPAHCLEAGFHTGGRGELAVASQFPNFPDKNQPGLLVKYTDYWDYKSVVLTSIPGHSCL
jgi:hypothetical protein